MDPLAEILQAGDNIREYFSTGFLFVRGLGQFLDNPLRHQSGFQMPVEKTSHAGGAQDHDLGDDRYLKCVDAFYEFRKLVDIKNRRRQKISGAEIGHLLHFLHFQIRDIFTPGRFHAGSHQKIGFGLQGIAFNGLPFFNMLQHGLQFAGIDMEKHHFLQAVAGNTVIFCKHQQIFYSGFVCLNQIFLQLQAIFIPRGGLVNGLELILIQKLTGFNRIADNPFKFHFRQRNAINTPPHPG